MARVTTRKSSLRKGSKGRSKKKRPGFMARINVGRVLFFLALVSLLVFSLGVVGYVVFFRTVVAAELPAYNVSILFEEPDPPGHISSHDDSAVVDSELHPRVAIIIDDMGYHREVGEGLLALDLNLTFSFLPYAPFTPDLEEEAYQRGRPILLHLPMEPRSPEWDPGVGALYLADSSDAHRQTLDENLQLVPHATGVNNHMGSLYTANERAMAELADMLVERQLFFIDSYTTAESKGLQQAREKGVPSARRHVFLDNVQQQQAICNQLKKLMAVAEQQGWAIGIGHPHPETLEAFTTCGPEIMSRVNLVAVNDLVQ